MSSDLHGQVALVTGATGGLGGAVTELLLRDGAQVYATYRVAGERDALLARLADMHERLIMIEADAVDPPGMDRLVSRIIDEQHELHILTHLVGGYLGGQNVEELSLHDWQRMMDLNLTSAFVACRAVLPSMRRQDYGRIVLVSSRSAVQFAAGVAAYTASKAAVLALVGSIAEENHRSGVTANAVLPSIIDTPANRGAMPAAAHDRWPKPDEIAEVIAFLVSTGSGLISGATIPVYGRA